LRGRLSPGEFAAAVRRSAREIGEQVSCDARYVGRVESGDIRCPNYAYERVFRHMFPGLTLPDMGFAPRETVRGRGARAAAAGAAPLMAAATPLAAGPGGPGVPLRTGGPAPAPHPHGSAGTVPGPRVPSGRRVGAAEAAAVEEAVRRIRLLDDRHGAEGLYHRAARPLRAAYALLDTGVQRRAVAARLRLGTGELALSVGWLAHDSGRFDDARSHYAEALATARVHGDPALEAHAFCNTSFLARDAGRPREALHAAQAAQRAAERLASPRLRSLLALREAGGRAGLADRTGCERALAAARRLFAAGACEDDPEWMTFYGEAELAGLEAQCWSALGDRARAACHARQAVALQDPHFVRNIALFTAELADDLAHSGAPEEAAVTGSRVLTLLTRVRSARIRAILDGTARALRPHRSSAVVAGFLDRHAAPPAPLDPAGPAAHRDPAEHPGPAGGRPD
jgi:tetratricopeptide (TPR) repeat protein